MIRLIYFLLFTLLSSLCLGQTNYQSLWNTLDKRDHKAAKSLISSALKDKSTYADSYITNIYLQSYDGKEDQITDFSKTFYESVENPYPYIYALWFNASMLGEYGKKQHVHQLELIDKIIGDAKAPGNLVAAAAYQKGIHFLFSNDIKNSLNEFAKVGNIKNWQFVGPFDNLSGSGFNKNYGPLEHPEGSYEFLIKNNSKVKWFVPTIENQDGWTPFEYNINSQVAVVYTQTFVESPIDQEVYLNFGVSGAIKAWLNDALILSEKVERVTEMDMYSVKVKLSKGVNRVLVQVGFSEVNYPNFNLRITDVNHRSIPTLKGSSIVKPYRKAEKLTSEKIEHFAESFFLNKIKNEPENLVNYMLLTDVYLRNRKTLEARNLMEQILQKHPNNSILHFQLINVLLKESNRSQLLEESTKLKIADPTSLFAYEIQIREDISNEKYDDARKKIAEREALYGEDMTTIEYKINMLAKENNYDELIKQVEKSFKDHPTSALLIPIMHAIKKSVYKDPVGAMKVFEDYLTDNYNYQVFKKYVSLLKDQGDMKRVFEEQTKLANNYPFDPTPYSELASLYFQSKDYKESEKFIREALGRSPYHKYYWEQLGDTKREMKQNSEAILAYEKSLMYDPNQFDVINKLRKLKGKTESYKIIPAIDIDNLIKKDIPSQALNKDVGYYIIEDDYSIILHPEGASEEYYTYIVRITNEKGIEAYKESSIGYGSRQTLLIEQAEVVKKSGAHIKGEKNDNQIVFTNLEVDDVVVFKYRLQNYNYGRFAKDFADKHFFKRSAYVAHSLFRIYMPSGKKLYYKTTNFDLQPTIKDVEDFKLYSWETTKQEAIKEESIMPAYVDVAPVLHVSTIDSWQNVANWYADLINNANEESYELTSLFNTLIPPSEAAKLTQHEKARRFYEFIQKNIRYSSVSFRQSAFLPQTASKTLTTKLGDCKDLSNLFMTLCKMAGIDCYMVLVSTYDNGAQSLVLPSTDFNHCIAKAILDQKEYYIELTDNYLPFLSLPNNLINAQILDIPKASESSILKSLSPTTKSKDIAKRLIYMKPVGNDLEINIKAVKYGHLSSQTRSSYLNLTYEKQLKDMEESVAGSYKNNVEMDTVVLQGLEVLSDSVQYQYTYKVKDEVMEIGDLQTFKIVYPDVIAALSKFPAITRTFPINYNEYEDTDIYDITVYVEIPKDKKITSLPQNENLTFNKMSYTLNYTLIDNTHLVVKRKFVSNRNLIPIADYNSLKAFMEKIVKAEQKMIAFQ